MKSWKILSRQTILQHSKYLTVEEHTVKLPDGRIIDNWPWVITPEYINVAVITEEDAFLCFRQTKYSVDGPTLAPVGGYLEPGEDPLKAAKRELLEETGYESPTWTGLGSYPVEGNRGCGVAHLFLARDARRVAEPDADDLEEQHLLHLSQDEVETAVANGDFKVLAWTTVMVLALWHLVHELPESFVQKYAVTE
jgi:ADP-ribose pyrophosphatase